MSRIYLALLVLLISVALSSASVVPLPKIVPAMARKKFRKTRAVSEKVKKATILGRRNKGNEENYQEPGGFGSFSARVTKYDKAPLRVAASVVKKAKSVARDRDSDKDDSDSNSDTDSDSDDGTDDDNGRDG